MVSLAVVAAALVAIELSLARWFPLDGVVYRLDRDLLHDARPNASRIQRMPRSTLGEGDAEYVRVTTGREGFRGGGLDLERDRPRVLVMGDSLVMAENVPQQATFVRQLARALEEELGLDAQAIESVNAGRSGYGPGQSLLLLQRIAPIVQPDVLVFVVCAHNDLGDLARNKLFSSRDGELVRENPLVSAQVKEWFWWLEQNAGRSALLRTIEVLRAGPVKAEVIGGDPIPLYLAALEQQWQDLRGPRGAIVDSLFQDIYDADIALGVDVSGGEKAAMLTAVAAEVLGAESAPGRLGLDASVPVHFVVVPSAIDVCRDFGLVVDPSAYPEHDPTRLTATVTAALEAAGASRVHDLDPLFRGLEDPDAHFVGGTDIHWNARGQRVAAREVARSLVAADGATRAALLPKR